MGFFDKVKQVAHTAQTASNNLLDNFQSDRNPQEELTEDETKQGFFGSLGQTTTNITNSMANSWSNLDAKSPVIKQATNINYDSVLTALNSMPSDIPTSLTPSIDLLKEAAETYNNSVSENKNDEYINYLVKNLDAQFILNTIEPVVKSIPFGSIIVYLLRFIVKKQNSKQTS